jgi:hypothetical protein
MCNFKIGQEVVTLFDCLEVKNGYIGNVLQIALNECKCSKYRYDIGIRSQLSNGYGSYCTSCGKTYPLDDTIVWFYDNEIAPLQTDSEEADMKEALKEVFERELFNL